LVRKRSFIAWPSVAVALAASSFGYVPLALLGALLCRAALDDIFAVDAVDGTLRVLRCRGFRKYERMATLSLAAGVNGQVAGSTLKLSAEDADYGMRFDDHCEALVVMERIQHALGRHGVQLTTSVTAGQFVAQLDTRAPAIAWLRPVSSLVLIFALAAKVTPAYGLLALFPIAALLERIKRNLLRLPRRQRSTRATLGPN
jgi:hypothetical protein